MPTINQVTLLGHLGKDPELRTFEDGNKLVTFTLATHDTYTDKQGKKKNSTDWHRIVVWGSANSKSDVTLADLVLNYFSKGDGCLVMGKLKPRRWEANGKSNTITEVVASVVVKMDKIDNTDTENPYGAP